MITRRFEAIGFIEKIGFLYLANTETKEKLCLDGDCVTILGKVDENHEIEIIEAETVTEFQALAVEEFEKRTLELENTRFEDIHGIVYKVIDIVPTILTCKEKDIMIVAVPEERGFKMVLAGRDTRLQNEFFPLIWDSLRVDYLDNKLEVTDIEENEEDLETLLEQIEEA